MTKQLLDIQETKDGKIHIEPEKLFYPFLKKLSDFTGEKILVLDGDISTHSRIILELKDGKKLVFQTGDTGEAWVAGFEKDEKIW